MFGLFLNVFNCSQPCQCHHVHDKDMGVEFLVYPFRLPASEVFEFHFWLEVFYSFFHPPPHRIKFHHFLPAYRFHVRQAADKKLLLTAFKYGFGYPDGNRGRIAGIFLFLAARIPAGNKILSAVGHDPFGKTRTVNRHPDAESPFACQKFGHPVEVSEISVQDKQVPRIPGNGFQAVVEHAAFPPGRPAQLRTEGKAGQHVVDKENPGKGAVGFTGTVGLYPEMASYLL